MMAGSSPHTRGALAECGGFGVDSGIIPAYAGSTAVTVTRHVARADHPRIRGEHMSVGFRPDADGGSSPHTRGARRRLQDVPSTEGIIPAYAGSTRLRALTVLLKPDHPRIRGEHPVWARHQVFLSGSSPHTRGAPSVPSWRRRRQRIIPAYAGSTCSSPWAPSTTSDHPRIRGEHCTPLSGINNAQGSSPHTRGARRWVAACCLVWRIIPAYAGSTAPAPEMTALIPGSSPHTRGAPHARRRHAPARRIIPAYAGSTWALRSAPILMTDHPRIRGEHHGIPAGEAARPGSSPHTRGARAGPGRGCGARRIIPAYAGSTTLPSTVTCMLTDHPRIRGEHKPGKSDDAFDAGSSPHTRGAPPHAVRKDI